MHAGLNKGEARNALARAVFFNRLGEIRDRSFEQQRQWASGLEPGDGAIVLWNTVYLERTANALRGHGKPSMTPVAVPVAARLGHQPDRRLPLAQQRKIGAPRASSGLRPLQPAMDVHFSFLERPWLRPRLRLTAAPWRSNDYARSTTPLAGRPAAGRCRRLQRHPRVPGQLPRRLGRAPIRKWPARRDHALDRHPDDRRADPR